MLEAEVAQPFDDALAVRRREGEGHAIGVGFDAGHVAVVADAHLPQTEGSQDRLGRGPLFAGARYLRVGNQNEARLLPDRGPLQARVDPVYEDIKGWCESTEGARSWADLPARAIKYVRRIEELIGAPVALLSTSPERDDTILMRDPFQD